MNNTKCFKMPGDLQSALNYAYRLLGFRSRTKHEIVTKLRGKGFNAPIIDEVIDKLEDFKYIDDRKFAQMWVKDRNQLKPMGKRRLRQELKLKGIEKNVIEEVINCISIEDEYFMAQLLVDKKMARKQYSKKQVVGFLARRGFDSSVIIKIADDLMD